MKKFIAMLFIILMFCNVLFGKTFTTDIIDGYYWQNMKSDTMKKNFLTGYLLGLIHEMDVIDIYNGYVIRARDPELADALTDFMNSDIIEMRAVTLDEYVNFLNECYRADKKNLNIPIVSMINFAIESQEMTKKEIKIRLSQLSKNFADKNKKSSR